MDEAQVWLNKAVDFAADYGPRLLGALLIWMVGAWIIKRLTKALRTVMRKSAYDESLQRFLLNLLSWALRVESEARSLNATPEYLGETRYSEALRRFSASIRSATTPPATIADGLLAVDLAAAIHESATTGQRVELPTA